MIALYIILGVAAVIAIILSLFVRVYFSFDGYDLIAYAKLGPLKFYILPEKPRRLKFRKTAKFLKGKKLANAKPRGKAKDFGRTGDTIEDLIAQLSETARNPELTRITLRLCKLILLYFRHMLRIEFKAIHMGIDAGDAARSAIDCGIAYQITAYVLEFLHVNTRLKEPAEGVIDISPVFNEGVSTYDISGIIRIRVINVIKAVATSAFRSAVAEANINQ